jgi:hypothetical protein
MKLMHGLVRKSLVVALVLAAVSPGALLHAEKAAAIKVIRLKGSARYSVDKKEWKDLKKGTVLKSGVLIQTAANTIVDICMNEARNKESSDGSEASVDNVLRVLENCTIGIDKLASDEIQLDLRNGTIMGTVGKLAAQSKYEIKLPHEMLGIRGGTYIADSSGVVNVIEGSAVLVVIGADNSLSTRKIEARQGYDPTSGGIVPLHLQIYPAPLTCEGTELPASTSTPTSGLPHGSGMGGSLRKF